MDQIYSPNRKILGEPKKPKPRRKIFHWFFLLILPFIAYKSFFWLKGVFGQRRVTEISLVQKQSIETVSDPNAKYSQILSYTISAGDIPADIFSSQGKLDANDTMALLAASKDVYDFTNLKIGRSIRFYFENEVRATRIEYDRDTERVIIVERAGDEFVVREEKIDYIVSQEIAEGTIDNFFYADALEAGLSESTVLEVGDIFSFDIDFTTEIQTGDTFSFIYEKRTRNGEKAPDGKILAGKFVNAGSAYYAYYFGNDGSGGYYDADGRVLERQFLKAPLSYRRISSGFTGARMHPITRKVSAHYQIDYAAPAGTPVVASARGTVISASWSGGWGNMVRLEHDNGYTTHYGHLSAFAKGLRSGARVDQGQLVGYVGSTGWSTGPHLDYGIKLNGTPVNPLKLDMPKGEPLSGEKLPQYEETKKQYIDLLR
ncbi:MAG: peptidoglycan DD-metalloendopeptidase family protein [Candidatus Moraniibacteriota bacterium]